MSARKTCRKCGGRFAIPMEEVEACADEGKCSLRSALRTERRKVRVLRETLREIAEPSPTRQWPHKDKCGCAWCLVRGRARRGLERAKERRKS